MDDLSEQSIKVKKKTKHLTPVKNESEKTEQIVFADKQQQRPEPCCHTEKRKETKGEFFPCSSFLSQGIYYYFLEKATQAQTICFAVLREIKLKFGKWGIKAAIFTSIPVESWLDLKSLLKGYQEKSRHTYLI